MNGSTSRLSWMVISRIDWDIPYGAPFKTPSSIWVHSHEYYLQNLTEGNIRTSLPSETIKFSIKVTFKKQSIVYCWELKSKKMSYPSLGLRLTARVYTPKLDNVSSTDSQVWKVLWVCLYNAAFQSRPHGRRYLELRLRHRIMHVMTSDVPLHPRAK